MRIIRSLGTYLTLTVILEKRSEKKRKKHLRDDGKGRLPYWWYWLSVTELAAVRYGWCDGGRGETLMIDHLGMWAWI